MNLRRHAVLLAAVLPMACAGPPPAPGEGNQIGSMGAPAAAVASDQTLPATAPTDNAAAPAPGEAAYLGKWIGVEGMVLDVSTRPGGGVRIANQWDLDHRGEFEGSVTAEGLRWTRGDETVVARPSDGDATGLKYLAGKSDCLTVKPGEGYCRR